MGRDDHQQILELIHQVGNRFVAIQKDLAVVHREVKFHASEFDFLGIVARSPGVHPTAIAERLNVTKGAVSQTMARLEKKGAIRKEIDGANNAALKVTLTPLGKGALRAFRRRIDAQWTEFAAHVHKLGAEEHETVLRFLTTLRSFLNKLA